MTTEEIVARALAKQHYKGLFSCYPDTLIDKCVDDHWKCFYDPAIELLKELGVRAVNPIVKVNFP